MTRRAFIASLAVFLCTLGAWAEQQNESKPPPLPIGKPVADDVQDFVFLDETRPVFLRLHVQIDGVGFRRVWQDQTEKAFDDADADRDGKLVQAEFNIAVRTSLSLVPGAGFAALDANPRDGRVDREEWKQWIRNRSGSAGDVTFTSAMQGGNMRNYQAAAYWMGGRAGNPAQALLRHLDVNNDKVLTKSELTAAQRTLRRLDLNDDEIISADELQPYSNALDGIGRVALTKTTLSVPTLLAIPSQGSTAHLARHLLNRYEGRGSTTGGSILREKVSRTEMALEPAEFRAADNDGDGLLDLEELAQMVRRAKPRLALLVRLGEDAGKLGRFARVPLQGQTAKDLALHADARGSLTVVLGSVHLQFSAASGGSVQSRLKYLEGQFKGADRDNNGYLDAKEAAPTVFNLNQQFALMDRDKNGMLFADEMTSFMKRSIATSLARVTARGEGLGKLLFDLMDTDRDRRLSQRELAAAAAKLPRWDRNGDGKLAAGEIPRRYAISISRGSGLGGWYPPTVLGSSQDLPARTAPITIPLPDAPAWFTKMDRNRDGDVSPREFLGSAKDFRRFDANGDGLIDKQEAARK